MEILQEDNVAREIPTVYRDNLELDIQGGLVNRKIVVARDLLLKIQCLNLVRKIVDGDVVQGNYITELKNSNGKGLDFLFSVCINYYYLFASIPREINLFKFYHRLLMVYWWMLQLSINNVFHVISCTL